MKFGPQKGHVACIFDNFFKDFGLVLIALIVSLVSGDMDLLSENVGVLVIVLLAPVLRVVGWLTTTYAVDEEKLLIKSGLFTRNELEVPLSTITTVDFSQNIFHQIFGVYKLNIDNNANIADGQTKVHMTLKKDDAAAVRSLLMKGRQGMDGSNFAAEQDETSLPHREEGTRYQVETSDVLLMGLLKSKLLFLLELFGAIAVIANLLPADIFESGIMDRLIEKIAEMGATPAVLITIAVLFVTGSLCGMIGSFIRYYGFKILDNGEAVKIEYGLLNRKTYTIAKKKISGVFYEQSALMRIAKVGILNLMAVGYGAGSDEDASEEAILFPLLKENQLTEVIGKILPEMQAVEAYQKPEPKALRYFFIRFSVFFALAVLAGSFFLPKVDDFFQGAWVLGALFLMYRLGACVMAYLTAGAYGNLQHFSFCYGGYKKMRVFVKTSMIESIESVGSRWKRKRGVMDINIGCLAPGGEATQIVDNLPESTFNELKEYLIY
ncbi:MAG: PH domain-containing protein [Firmicutes bacterium]|nr:PH domain-containing protein [Bacillota bacterium]